MKLTKGTV